MLAVESTANYLSNTIQNIRLLLTITHLTLNLNLFTYLYLCYLELKGKWSYCFTIAHRHNLWNELP